MCFNNKHYDKSILSFTIGTDSGDHLTIYIHSAAKSTHRYYDWVDVQIRVEAGSFTGMFYASLQVHDFVYLRSEFNRLYNDLTGLMKFEAQEEQLYLEIIGDGKGHFEANCVARDKAGMGNKLEFALSFDQTFIPPILRDLDKIITQYPAVN